MLILLSPAKTMDFDQPRPALPLSEPEFMAEARELVSLCAGLPHAALAQLMKMSPVLTDLNAARFADWPAATLRGEGCAALLAFRGEVYAGLAADDFSDADLAYAQTHLRILCGLYGVLAPLDRIQPYRLEMATKLANSRGKDLYAFWKTALTAALNRCLVEASGPVLNLASLEYSKAFVEAQLQADVISPVFEDEKDGQYKIISMHAKKARGLLARYLIRQRSSDPEALAGFAEAGYRYQPALSTPTRPVFRRPA